MNDNTIDISEIFGPSPEPEFKLFEEFNNRVLERFGVRSILISLDTGEYEMTTFNPRVTIPGGSSKFKYIIRRLLQADPKSKGWVDLMYLKVDHYSNLCNARKEEGNQ